MISATDPLRSFTNSAITPPESPMTEVERRLEIVKAALRKWDPIGVIESLVESDLPPDEYDSYAPYLLQLVESGAPARRIASHFVSLRMSSMGLGKNGATEFETDIAEKLEIWQRSGFEGEPDFRFMRYAL